MPWSHRRAEPTRVPPPGYPQRGMRGRRAAVDNGPRGGASGSSAGAWRTGRTGRTGRCRAPSRSALAAVAEVEYAWTGRGDSDTGVVLSLLATATARPQPPPALVGRGADRRRGRRAAVPLRHAHHRRAGRTADDPVRRRLPVPAPAQCLALLPLAGNVVYPYTGATGHPGRRPAAARGRDRRRCGWVTPPDNVGPCSPSTTPPVEQVAEARHDQAVLAERARIARELHDVVAHHVSMMVVQAESTRISTDGLPPAGRESLAAIGETGRQALTEMRRLLGVLRTEHEPSPALATAARAEPARRTALLRLGMPATRCAWSRLGEPRAAAPGRRARRLPDHPGGADQRPAARRRGRASRSMLRYAAGRLHLTVTQRGAGGRAGRVPPGTGCSGCGSGRPASAASVHIGPRRRRRLPGRGGAARPGDPVTHPGRAWPTTMRWSGPGSARCSATQPDIDVVGAAADGAEAVEHLPHHGL